MKASGRMGIREEKALGRGKGVHDALLMSLGAETVKDLTHPTAGASSQGRDRIRCFYHDHRDHTVQDQLQWQNRDCKTN